MRRRAFTLVELLVVVGIIALLVGILMPGLTRARESARRTNCLANLRSVGQVGQLLNLYANQNREQIPIGFTIPTAGGTVAGAYLNDCFITRASSIVPSPGENIRYVGLGLLMPAKLMSTGDEGRVFYCPSMNEDTPHSFGSDTNPWPPTGPGPAGWLGTRIAYSSRPSDPTSTRPFGLHGVAWVSDATAASPTFYPVDESGKRTDMMRPSRLRNRAIVADVVSSPEAMQAAHVRGVNVLYADGSAKWVLKDAMYGTTFPLPMIEDALSGTGTFSVAANIFIEQFWSRLDTAP
jgi:prepilin-type N-terminal cleavage/methylation domain-containing protein/prepilin-type processing-associated H-X9-DG protein